MKNLITLFLLLLVVPVFSLTAQDKKELKACLQEGNKYFTPQLAGSNPADKPAITKDYAIYSGNISSSASRVPKPVKKADPISLAQLQMKMSKAESMLDEVTVYSSVENQRAPQIAQNVDEKFVVFENEDTDGGSYPFGTIDIYSSSNGGASWEYFDGLYHSSYRLTSPRIQLVGTDIIIAYLSNGNFWTYKWGRLDGSYISSAVSAPVVSATEFVADFRIVSDVEDGSIFPYLYAAFIFKQSDGTQRVLFSRSTDTTRTWEPFFTLGATQTELGMFSLGLDYCSSGLFVAYLGTDTSAGSVLIRKSILYGSESSWSPEVKLPMYYNGGNNKKFGPEISAIGSHVAVIYQYDYYGDASDWKTASDFDIYAVVSNDGGASWEERMVNSTYSSEILPGISCDYDGNFYVAYLRDSRVRISMAGQEFVFGVADSSMSANPSFNVSPSICGATVPYNNTAYTVWTAVDNTTGADILGAETVLKIPPASPTDLVITPVSGNEIKLTWTDNSMDEAGFAIFSRQAGTPDEFVRIGTVAANTIAFTTTLTSSSGNNYYVRSYNENGFSLRTNIETAYPSTGDLIAYYPFNGNTNDESGNGNNGTNNGATLTLDRFGNANSAYNFNGTSNKIVVPGFHPSINRFTISIWLNTSIANIGVNTRWLIGDCANYNGYCILQQEDSLRFQVFGGVGVTQGDYSVALTSADQGNWIHVAMTNQNGIMKIYKNGLLMKTAASPSVATASTYSLGIGHDELEWFNSYWNGKIDDICIFNSVLGDNEISILYHENGWGVVDVPTAPSNLEATAVNATQVNLTWQDNSSDENGFHIERRTGTAGNYAEITSVGSNITSYQDNTVITNTLYYYRITAYNNVGISTYSNEASATPTGSIDNTPPTVTLNPTTGTPVVVLANGQIVTAPQVNATASDAETGVYQMQVAYRNTLQQTWTYSPFVNSSTINYEIPVSAFVNNNKPIGVDYRVGAWDNAGNFTWSDYASFDVQMGPLVTDQPPFAFPAASQLDNKTTAYRMISVPYNLSNKRPANLLNSFGDHAENGVSYVKWRFQRYASGQYQDYDQFSTQNVVTPGAAFFLIVKDQGSQITVQGESLNRFDVMYNTGISLQNGWNLVGNPFTIQYPLNDLEFFPAATPAVRGTIRQFAYYSGSGVVSGWDTSRVSISTLKPWSGAAVFVNSAGTLRFPSAGQLSGLPKVPVSQTAKINAPDWTLAINAYRSEIGMRCEGSTIGMTKGASEGDDAYDSYIPPIVGDKNVAVYFRNADGAMMRDIRPLSKEGSVWEMKVVTGDANARVNLQWNNDLNLPDPSFEAYLIDTDQKTAHNLKQIKSLEINSGDGARSFRIVVGKKSFIEVNNAGVALLPSSVKLYANYPNPFNPETVIRYSLPESSESYSVELKVFNVIGQEIATLVNEQKAPGYYEAKFNGANQSSGIYFYQISVTGGNKTYREIKKMVLMK